MFIIYSRYTLFFVFLSCIPIMVIVVQVKTLTLFSLWEGGMMALYHNFVVVVPMIMKFDTCMKLYVPLLNYDVITCNETLDLFS